MQHAVARAGTVVLALSLLAPEASAAPPTPSPDTGDPSELPSRPPARVLPLAGRAEDEPPAKSRGPYVHDGLFARLAVGPGLFQASSGSSSDTRTFSGGAVSIDAALGGAPSRGFIIGGEAQTNRVFSLSSHDEKIDGDEPDLSDTRFSVTSIGVFAELYPDPTDGLHFMAAIGTAWMSVSHSRTSDSRSPTGPIFSAGGGYEWFVGPNLSLGVLLRANLGIFSVDEAGNGSTTSVTTFIPALLAGATYN